MNTFLVAGIVLFVYMTAAFVIAVIRRRNDVADIAWGVGFVVLAWLSFAMASTHEWQAIVVNLLVTLWGFRLARHIFRRHKNKPEDSRYAAWRKQWGKIFYLRSYLQVFLLQGVFLFLIASPTLLLNQATRTTYPLLIYLGIAVWLGGFVFESVADTQLARFVRNPANAGKVMQSGLWRYSRHPNYFGEVTMWWGIFIVALSVPNGIYTIVGPLTITTLILFVSGIPLLEKRYKDQPEYQVYSRRTSVFIPLPPRKS